MGVKAGAGTESDNTTDDDFEDEEVDQPEDEQDDTSGAGDDEEFDKDRALATIKAQRESEKKLKMDLAAIRKEMKQIKDKDLPASEKQAADLAEAVERAEKAERALQKSTVRTTALEEATSLGFKNPSLAYRLIDADDIEWDDDQPANIKSLLRDILKDDPYLKGGRRKSAGDDEDDEDDDADAGAGRRSKGRGGFDMNRNIRQQAGRA